MKTVPPPVILIMIAAVNLAHGQMVMQDWAARHEPVYPVGVKQAGAKYGTNRMNTISIRAVRSLKTNFPSVSGEKWHSSKSGFTARFSIDSTSYTTAYDKHGNWKYTILHYNENKLPSDVRHTIKRSYYDYTIMHVQEIRLHDDLIFQVAMQDRKSWIIVQVKDHEMHVVKRLRKTNESDQNIRPEK